MTDSKFKRQTKGKSLNEFTRAELFKACEFDKFDSTVIISIAKSKNWDDVVEEALSYETTYDYFGHSITV